MVVFSTFEVSTIFEKSKLISEEKDEEKGVTKKGDPFIKRKFKYLDPEKRCTSLIVRFSEVESFGLKKFKNGGRGKSYSFSIVLEPHEEERIKKLVRSLEKFAKSNLPNGLRKALSFEKFSPIKNSKLFCRVPSDPANQIFFTRFQDKGHSAEARDFMNAECLVDAALFFSGVFISNGNIFLQAELSQVRKLEDLILTSYLPPFQQKDTPFEARAKRKADDHEYESGYESPAQPEPERNYDSPTDLDSEVEEEEDEMIT